MPSQSESSEGAQSSAERRLARLRFDLHDGPQQDLVLLGQDLEVLRVRLDDALQEHPDRGRVLAALDDLQARLVLLDSDLRGLASFVESPFLATESVPDALGKLAAEFASRAGFEPELALDGDFSSLSESQQITLLNLIREALTNVREHSGAGVVRIAVSSGPEGVQATVFDDGRGFDPDSALERSARDGHLGLVGMHERVKLLGGLTTIKSRAGGPTTVSFSLPAWRPQP